MLVIICTWYENKPSRTVGVTERTMCEEPKDGRTRTDGRTEWNQFQPQSPHPQTPTHTPHLTPPSRTHTHTHYHHQHHHIHTNTHTKKKTTSLCKGLITGDYTRHPAVSDDEGYYNTWQIITPATNPTHQLLRRKIDYHGLVWYIQVVCVRVVVDKTYLSWHGRKYIIAPKICSGYVVL